MNQARSIDQQTTIGSLLARTPRTLQLDAQLLIGHALNCSRAHVMAHSEKELGAKDAQSVAALITRREAGEPLAYLLGEREFFGLTLAVSPSVLIPRADTELLVEQCLALAKPNARVLDLGTGSGAIAIALKHSRPDLIVTALDKDPAALAVAQGNAQRHACEVHWLLSDWFQAFNGEKKPPQFDFIVSNPPYIAHQDPHMEELRFEPHQALVAGQDGLADYRVICAEAARYLASDGLLLLEQGAQQAAAVAELLQRNGFRELTTRQDLAGHERVTLAGAPRHTQSTHRGT